MRLSLSGEALIEARVQACGVPGQQIGDEVDGVVGDALAYAADFIVSRAR